MPVASVEQNMLWCHAPSSEEPSKGVEIEPVLTEERVATKNKVPKTD